MHLLQQLRDGFKPQILPAALTLQKIPGLSTHFIPASYLPGLRSLRHHLNLHFNDKIQEFGFTSSVKNHKDPPVTLQYCVTSKLSRRGPVNCLLSIWRHVVEFPPVTLSPINSPFLSFFSFFFIKSELLALHSAISASCTFSRWFNWII